MKEHPNCPRCNNSEVIKFGFVKKQQRWQCKACEYRFTRLTPRGKPPALKALAVALHGVGLSFNAVGTLLNISAQSVIDWVRQQAASLPKIVLEKPVDVVELDEMWHFLHKKTTKSGSGKHTFLVQIDSLTGKLAIAAVKR